MRLYNLTMKVNRLEMLKSMIGLEMVASIDEMQKYFDEKLMQRTIDEFKRQAGILGKSVRDPTGNAKSIVNASFHHANFSTRLWGQQTTLKSQLSMLLQRGMIQGKGSRQLAPELRKMFGVTKYEAERLMRTELTRVRTAAQMQSFEKNGFDRYMFLNFTSAPYTKSPVCEICKEVGQKCEEEKGFPVKDMMPGENAPPLHPGCRCSVAAYMDREEFDEWLNGSPGKPVKSVKTLENATGSGKIVVHRSLGAAAKKYQVKLNDSNQHAQLAEKQTIRGKTFDGKGAEKEIRDRYRLESNYGAPASEWSKVSGKGYVIVGGKKRLAELHWYEAEGEIYEMKVKRYLDEG